MIRVFSFEASGGFLGEWDMCPVASPLGYFSARLVPVYSFAQGLVCLSGIGSRWALLTHDSEYKMGG